MNRSFAPLFVASILAATACHAVDLTPHFVTRTTGTWSKRIPYFTEGDKRYTLRLAPGMSVFDENGAARFHFENPEGASLLMKISPLPPGSVPFTNTEAYQKQALGALPDGAHEVELQKGSPNALSMPGKQSLGVVHAFKLPGRRFIQGVWFVNFSGSQQIMLVLTAPADGYNQAVEISSDLVRSWRAVAKGEDLSIIPAT